MVRFFKDGSTWLFNRGAYGFALALPVLAGTSYSNLINEDAATQREAQKLRSFNVAQVVNPPKAQNSPFKSFTDENRLNGSRGNDGSQTKVLITEVVIEGIDNHPEQERLEFAAYDAMSVRPGSNVRREELKRDLDAIYATGWFSGVRIEPIDGPLGVQLLVEVEPNPVLKRVDLLPKEVKISTSIVNEVFRSDYGKTLNLNVLKLRMNELKS